LRRRGGRKAKTAIYNIYKRVQSTEGRRSVLALLREILEPYEPEE
jgi:hypothetical protein